MNKEIETKKRGRGRPVEEDARHEAIKLRLNGEEASYLDSLSKELGWTKAEVLRFGVGLVGACKDRLK